MAQETFLDPAMPDIIRQWEHYLERLEPVRGARVLDVGCNTGDALRLLLRRYPDVGPITGIDHKPVRIDAARERCAEEIRAGRLDLMVADARRLPFADGSLDRVLCAEVLEWVRPPEAALAEIRRVLRPDGLALVIHSDFDTQIFSTQDNARSRTIVQAFADSGPRGQIGRELPSLCHETGFDVETSVHVLVNEEWSPMSYAYRMAGMMADWLKKDADLRNPIEEWRRDLETAARSGRFFYSINRVICRCRLP